MNLVILIHGCIETQCAVESQTFNLVTTSCLVNYHCPDLCGIVQPSITSLGKDHNSRSKLLFLLDICGICIFYISCHMSVQLCARRNSGVK